MKIFERIENFIDNKDLEIHFIKNKLYITNYSEIFDFNNTRIVLKQKDSTININGKNLVITKLINEELMICGEISNIELR